MTSTIGIPIKLLNEAQVYAKFLLTPHSVKTSSDWYLCTILLTMRLSQGHVVTLEITSGQVYRGKLLEGSSFHTPAHAAHSRTKEIR